MDEDTNFLKARDLAERAGLPETDVKRFLRTYGEFFTSAKQGRTLGALSDIKALQETIGELRAEVAALREKVTDHEQKVIGHQQQIRLLRHDVDEGKTESLARRLERRNTPFWRRVFPGKDAPRR
jgi:uncharacterized coiled-coil protein SlyX